MAKNTPLRTGPVKRGRQHVALVSVDVADKLRSGKKRIESRFYRTKKIPIGRVQAGDWIHFKIVGGAFFHTARVSRVRQYSALQRADLDRLRVRYNHQICGSSAYWRAKRTARYGLLIWFSSRLPAPEFPRVHRQFGSGWVLCSQ